MTITKTTIILAAIAAMSISGAVAEKKKAGVARDPSISVTPRDCPQTSRPSVLLGSSGMTPVFGNDNASGEVLNYSGSNGSVAIFGKGGGDKITGGPCDDAIFGESGADELYGGAGDDFLNGGSDQGIVYGGDGDDIIAGSSGDAQLRGERGDDVIVGGPSVEQIFGGDGNDILKSGAGAGSLNGGNGDDVLIGGAGDKALFGGAGDDFIKSGADGQSGYSLIGGPGADILVGGPGPHSFAHSPGDGDDIIVAFSTTEHGINLTAHNTNAGNVTIIDNAAGDSVITMPSGEKIRVIGVSAAAISSSIAY